MYGRRSMMVRTTRRHWYASRPPIHGPPSATTGDRTLFNERRNPGAPASLICAPAPAYFARAGCLARGPMSREQKYLPTLDGWRGIAVIGVILYHGREEFSWSNSLPVRLAAHCYLGVD